MLWQQHPTGEGVRWLLPETLASGAGKRRRVIKCAPRAVDSAAVALHEHPHKSTEYLGLSDLPPRTAPVDLGYDHFTVEGHLEQSSHLMEVLKISTACWMADEAITRRKVASASIHSVPTVIGSAPFAGAIGQEHLTAYFDLSADMGATRVECGEGLTGSHLDPAQIVRMARGHGLVVQFELEKVNGRPFTGEMVGELIDQGRRWMDAGAVQLVVEAPDAARGVGLFDESGHLNRSFADRLAQAFGLESVVFEAPGKESQLMMLDHFGRDVHLCGVRLEDLLRVEIYRRGLHGKAFGQTRSRRSPLRNRAGRRTMLEPKKWHG